MCDKNMLLAEIGDSREQQDTSSILKMQLDMYRLDLEYERQAKQISTLLEELKLFQKAKETGELADQMTLFRLQQHLMRPRAEQDDPRKNFISQKLDRSESLPVSSVTKKTVNQARYKTELCRQYEEEGKCRYGEKCQFAHGEVEKRSLERHPKYKTEMCRTFHQQGFCNYGLRCNFIHNEDERRHAAPQRETMTQGTLITPLVFFPGEISGSDGSPTDTSAHPSFPELTHSMSALGCFYGGPTIDAQSYNSLPSTFEGSFHLLDAMSNSSKVSGFQNLLESSLFPADQKSRGRPILSRFVSGPLPPGTSAAPNGQNVFGL